MIVKTSAHGSAGRTRPASRSTRGSGWDCPSPGRDRSPAPAGASWPSVIDWGIALLISNFAFAGEFLGHPGRVCRRTDPADRHPRLQHRPPDRGDPRGPARRRPRRARSRPWCARLLLCLVIPAVIFDPDQRGLHDKAMNTVLVRVGPQVACQPTASSRLGRPPVDPGGSVSSRGLAASSWCRALLGRARVDRAPGPALKPDGARRGTRRSRPARASATRNGQRSFAHRLNAAIP